jgi:hypothetical protein
MSSENPKDKAARTRPPLSCIPCPVLFEVGAALYEGARKYGRHNWRTIPVDASVYYDAAMRHLMAFWEGEDIDPDSGVHHISKAIAGLIVLRDAQMGCTARDDRPPKRTPGWLADVQRRVAWVAENVKGATER